jgi:hypothetical protein
MHGSTKPVGSLRCFGISFEIVGSAACTIAPLASRSHFRVAVLCILMSQFHGQSSVDVPNVVRSGTFV